MTTLQDIVSFFTGKGYTQNQAAGIAGNLSVESSLNPAAVGDSGSAYGLAQWHPDRQALFQQVMGVPMQGSSVDQQLSFIDYELKNGNAGNFFSTSTISDAAASFMINFERPAGSSSLGARIDAASAAVGQGGWLGSLHGFEKSILTGLGMSDNAATVMTNPNSGVSDVVGISPLSFLSNLFTARMAGRFSAVIVGIILIAVAVIAFVLIKGNGQDIVAKITPST